MSLDFIRDASNAAEIFKKTMKEIDQQFSDQYIENGKRSKREKTSPKLLCFLSEEKSVERFRAFFNVFYSRFREKVVRDFAVGIR